MAPDYDLDDEFLIETADQLKAVSGEVRFQILDLVLERAATVTELAAALDRPRSSVAYHVDALVEAGVLKVVRTRKVRAIEERFYGRTARVVIYGTALQDAGLRSPGFLTTALGESAAHDDQMLSTLRHARIPADRAREFFDRVAELADEFTTLEREGDTVHGFVAAVYPTDLPILPASEEDDR